jgi:glutamate N-acetyltransferase/amino-acid N-acetyltransferase
MIKKIDGNVCAAQGFLATGMHVGVRKNTTKPDLAIIYSTVPAVAAGVFTLNKARAAPVLLTQKNIAAGQLQAIVVNSGNANACTGKLGMEHAKQMAAVTAKGLKLAKNKIAVSSTGVIGLTLPIDKITTGITNAIPTLSDTKANAESAAKAIMTTDTFHKEVAIQIKLGGKTVRIGGIAKGSGMIHPNMATMLGFITTDAAITPAALQKALSQENQRSFNMISVDGDSSTNDMVIVLANGLAQNKKITSLSSEDGKLFAKALSYVCVSLAKQIVLDGEGATKTIEVQLKGAVNEKQAQIAARAVSVSPLVKTAIFGEDANWGRIASALGASGANVDVEKLSISLGKLPLFKKGTPLPFDEDAARKLLQEKSVVIKIDLGKGQAVATAWGCDLTYDYIKINASYRS